MTKRSINYAFTHFETELQKMKDIDEIECEYIIIGDEVCPETGREHKQGFVHFRNALSLSGAQQRLCNYKMHIEGCKGSIKQNVEYCKKEGKFIERGLWQDYQGKRTDLDRVRDQVNEGAKMADIISTATGYQSLRMGELMLKYTEVEREWGFTDAWWFWGPDSEDYAWEKAHALCSGEAFRVYTPVTAKWWDGYDAHDTVIITDEEIIRTSKIKKLTGAYPFRVETKGGSREALYKRIIFASELHPHTFEIDRKILKNRFKIVDCGNEVGGNTNPDLIGEKECVGSECSCEDPDDAEMLRRMGFVR